MAPRQASTRNGNDPHSAVLEELQGLQAKDFSYAQGQILGSMCTEPHPVAVKAHHLFLRSNLGDPGHFPGAKEVEDRYLAALLELAGAAPPSGASGQVTSGGSEANILALGLIRETTGKTEVIVPKTGHFSFEKAAKFMRMTLRVADVDAAYRVRPEAVRKLVGPKTAGLIGIAGTTQVGSVDPLRDLAEIAQDRGVAFHVDAALGGYLLPFLAPPRPFGFDLAGVTSVTMDSHKMGMGTLGAGALLVRHAENLDRLAVETPYLSTPRQRGVLGTRGGAPVAAAWAVWRALGAPGYERVARECVANAQHLVRRLREHGLEPLIPPELNLVAVPVPEPVRVQDHLTRKGWRVNVLPRLGALRIVCMPHVTRPILDRFVPDLARAVERTGGGPRAPKAAPKPR